MEIIFDKLDSFFPFNEGHSIYLHKIAGRFLGEIILENMLANKQGNKYKFILLNDHILAENSDFYEAIKKYLAIKNLPSKKGINNPLLYYTKSNKSQISFRYPWDVLAISEDYLGKIKRKISNKAEIEKNVEIDGNVIVEAGVKILNGAKIKGSVFIGRNSFLTNNILIRKFTSIGQDCTIAYSTDIKSCVMQNKTGIGPLSFFGDSLIGNECFCGGIVRCSNYRLDGKNVEVIIRGERVATGRRFLGCFLGNKTSLGIGTIVLPGRTIGNNAIIGPNIVISKNVQSNCRMMLKQDISVEEIIGKRRRWKE
jgi:bifunctional UDP-N-acetylglucosamine pyrophosphorylase/glucosamine-1-phosphate N-acetyltransferase